MAKKCTKNEELDGKGTVLASLSFYSHRNHLVDKRLEGRKKGKAASPGGMAEEEGGGGAFLCNFLYCHGHLV